MPHDGLDNGSGSTIMQAIVSSREAATQTTAPERCGAAPACADVVGHKQAMLNQVCVWPDSLVGIFWQHVAGTLANLLGIGLGAGINPHIVATSSPRRTMAVGAAYLLEQFLTTLHISIV